MKSLFYFLAGLALAAPVLAADGPATRPATFTIPGTVVQFTMVRVPGGPVEVKVGDEVTKVDLKPFWIGMTEVTWDEYDVWYQKFDLTDPTEKIAVVGVTRTSNPYMDPTLGLGHDGFAAINVASHAADMYCKWLSAKTGRKFRLPTEAEWEHACRTGRPAEMLSAAALDPIAWYRDNSADENGDLVPHRVATKKPNAWGLYDTLGNIGEWVAGVDGKPVVKGGSYRDGLRVTQSTGRQPYNRNWQMRDPQDPKSIWWLSDGPHIGFRLAMDDEDGLTKSE